MIIENLDYKYKNGENPILSSISFNWQTNEITYIFGKNGSGKSTLGKILSNILPLQNKQLSNLIKRQHILYLPQNLNEYMLSFDIKQNMDIKKILGLETSNIFFDIISDLLNERMDFTCFSYSEKKIIGYAAFLSLSYDGYIFDEPFASFSKSFQQTVIDFIKILYQNNKLIMLLTPISKNEFIQRKIVNNLPITYYELKNGKLKKC